LRADLIAWADEWERSDPWFERFETWHWQGAELATRVQHEVGTSWHVVYCVDSVPLPRRGYETPEEAARGDMPPRYCRVLATSESGDFALVLLATNEPPYVELYGVRCRRRDGLWFDEGGSSGTGMTWSISSDRDLGDLACSWEAPAGADRLRIQLLGNDHEIETQNGYCLFLAHDVPDDELPVVKAWRVDGEWR
jgi:hypothetical protein